MKLSFTKIIIGLSLLAILPFLIWYIFFTSLNIKVDEQQFSKLTFTPSHEIYDITEARKIVKNLNSLKVVKNNPKIVGGDSSDITISIIDKTGDYIYRFGVYGSHLFDMKTREWYNLDLLNLDLITDYHHERLLSKITKGVNLK